MNSPIRNPWPVSTHLRNVWHWLTTPPASAMKMPVPGGSRIKRMGAVKADEEMQRMTAQAKVAARHRQPPWRRWLPPCLWR